MKNVAGLISVFMVGLAIAADTHLLLSQLRADLTEARSLPMGAKTSYRCPAKLDQLKGIAFTAILTALPKPDYENGGSISYFLTSPIPLGQRGGGFPEVTFVSDKSGAVERITCFYSK